MLKAAGLPPPRALLVHGWWTLNGAKMSKSTGNFIAPAAFAASHGADALRYFVIREMSVGQDSDFSQKQFLARYNAELADNLGNLVNRALNMTNRFAAGHIPASDETAMVTGASSSQAREQDAPATLERDLRALWEKTRDEVIALDEGFQFHIALERVFAFITATNAYIEKCAPWKLAKSAGAADQSALRLTLATMCEALRLANALLYPVMPGITAKIRDVLGAKPAADWREELNWSACLAGSKVAASVILFPKHAQAKTV